MNAFIKVSQLSYMLPDGKKLLSDLNYTFAANRKVAIIGNNGIGKSTLLKIIVGLIRDYGGNVSVNGKILYIPQDISYMKGTIADILGIMPILKAIRSVEAGDADPAHFEIIGQQWNLEQEIKDVFQLLHIVQSLDDKFELLSGGEKEKILLAKCYLIKADFIVLDEPTNNLDVETKEMLYEFIKNYDKGMIIVSHDRTLLNKMSEIAELTAKGLKTYGGNYGFYQNAKQEEIENLEQKKAFLVGENQRLMKTKAKIAEQKSKSIAEGNKAVKNKKYSKLVANSLQGSADVSSAKKNNILDKKIDKNKQEIYQIGWDLTNEKIKIPLPQKPFIKQKLLEVKNISFGYDHKLIIKNISFLLSGQDRLQIKGKNGSGKSTLIKLIIGELKPQAGEIYLNGKAIYVNQNLDLLDRNKTILDNMIDYNSGIKIEEAHAILANFKFRNIQADKLVSTLSGGELLRASLATVLGTQNQPDMIILDEPTNNLDIESIEILETALSQYQGAVIVVSHDEEFIKNIGVTKVISL